MTESPFEVPIICQGRKRNRHAPRHLGKWRPSAGNNPLGWWVSVDHPDDVEYEQPEDGTPNPRWPKRHRSIEERTVEREQAFEDAHGFRFEQHLQIRCTQKGCALKMSRNYANFCKILDRARELGVPQLFLIDLCG